MMENTNSLPLNQLNSTIVSNSNALPNSADIEKFPNPSSQTLINNEDVPVDSPLDDTESLDSNSSNKKDISPRPAVARTVSRNITVQTLMKEGVLEPGVGVLTIDYLGQKFAGDLLQSGKILWENTEFTSPSSWATFIKKRLNPSKKSGSGWNSVKYKGKKLDKLKSSWVQKNNKVLAASNLGHANITDDTKDHAADSKPMVERHSIKSADLRNLTTVDPNLQLDYEYYSETKPQPFSVIIYSSVMAVMDFHCHLSNSEVVGYLGGNWDPSKKCLYITHAFPCCCKLYEPDIANLKEQEINNHMRVRNLLKVGWYHSHPMSLALPTLQDVDVQFEMQVTNKNHPLVAIICDPYFSSEPSRAESIFNVFWVTSLNPMSDFPVPMNLKCGELSEQGLSKEAMMEFRHLVDYYVSNNEVVPLNKLWKGSMTYFDKIQVPLQRKIMMSTKAGVQVLQYLRSVTTSTVTT